MTMDSGTGGHGPEGVGTGETDERGAARDRGLLARLLGAWRKPALPARTRRTAYDFAFRSIDGGLLDLSTFRGRALLVVNTASQCGFTAQYVGMQHLFETYEPRGLTVIGVPSNDFGAQEPGTEEQIKAMCRSKFGVRFPMTAKTPVVGSAAHPFYRWAEHELGPAARPRWNFHKFLVRRDGTISDWFSTITGPTSGRVTRAIERAIEAPAFLPPTSLPS
jgi:glutathione peroxidase